MGNGSFAVAHNDANFAVGTLARFEARQQLERVLALDGALIGACEAPVRDAPVDLGAVAEGIVGAVEHLRDRHHFEQHRDLPRREAELEAIFAWHGGAMAAHYTREANRAR